MVLLNCFALCFPCQRLKIVIKKRTSNTNPSKEGMLPHQCEGQEEEEDPAPKFEVSRPSTLKTDQSLDDWLDTTLLSAPPHLFLRRYSSSSDLQMRGSKELLVQPILGLHKRTPKCLIH